MNEPRYVILADGTEYVGHAFGGAAPTAVELAGDAGLARRLSAVGECVFNTAMSGYVEVMTDPSYTGQIVAMTYPHVGNYGVDRAWSEAGPENDPAARPVKAAGVIARRLYRGPVPAGRQTFDWWLAEAGVPGVEGIDTRALTLSLRDDGSRNALIVRPADGVSLTDDERQTAVEVLRRFPAMEGRALIGEVGSRDPVAGDGAAKGPHIALYDCGAKANIVRRLLDRGCRLSVLPSTASAADIRATGADAVLLSNGPGDPAVLEHQVAQARELVGTLPLLGICLGHQIIAEALGARTSKMPFGHHGVNHPVRDERTGRVFVTSQNHGFTVDEATMPSGTSVWFRNANDGSIEGMRDDARKVRTTQFHPEAAPGPRDSDWIFDAFLEGIGNDVPTGGAS